MAGNLSTGASRGDRNQVGNGESRAGGGERLADIQGRHGVRLLIGVVATLDGGVRRNVLAWVRRQAQSGDDMEEGTGVFVLDLPHEGRVVDGHVAVFRRVATK